MKEATGELSTTAIAIVAIGLILAIFTTILLPMIRTQITLNQACNSGPGFSGDKVCCTAIGATTCGRVPTGTQKGSKTCSGTSVSGSTSTGNYTCYYYE